MKYLIAVSLLVHLVVAHPFATPQQDRLKFTIPSEWNLVPDEVGRLRMLHKSEIKLSDAEPFFTAETEVRFLLYTNQNPIVAQIFGLGDSLSGSNFNPNLPTRITIHGWRGDIDSGVNRATAAASLSVGQFNFITVDWSRGAGTLNYIDARNRIVDTARVVAQFIDRHITDGLINLNTLVLIGHSLGAHAAGLVGKNLQSGRLPVIVGCDPAGPLFDYGVPNERLDAADANFVEAIHTAGGMVGIMDPIGQANFYPNGGRSQPGCGFDLTGSCAHGRSHEFYAESLLNSSEFWAVRCGGFNEIGGTCTPSGPSVRMGGEPPNRDNANGIYFLTTGSSAPFAL